MESLISRIVELAERDKELASQAYGVPTFKVIVNFFPKQREFNDLPGKNKEKLDAFWKELVKRRQSLQSLIKVHIPITKKNPTTAGLAAEVDNYAAGNCTSGPSKVRGNSETFDVKGLVAFDPPRRDPDCRICQTLEQHGDTEKIYEDHVHSFPTGCPRYIAMSIEQRNDTAAKAKLCMNCHEPKYFYKKGDNHRMRARTRGGGGEWWSRRLHCVSCPPQAAS